MYRLLAGLLCLSLGTSAVAEDSCAHRGERSEQEGSAVRKVVIQAGAGELAVRGEAGRSDVAATGRACASSQALLDAIRLDSHREGDTLYLSTVLPSTSEMPFGVGPHSHMDLTVLLPKSVSVIIEDTSGDLDLSNVQTAQVTDSSGDQAVSMIAGDLDLTDSSGEVDIRDVGGTARISDSSGDLHVANVRGDVVVNIDSSGDMRIDGVTGRVRIVQDSSGDIEIRDVQRDVVVEHDSSGEIRVERVGGDFEVRSDGSGGISHAQVAGTVRLPD